MLTAKQVTKNKLVQVKVAFFSSYIEEYSYVDFVPFSEVWGMAAFGRLGSAFEGHGSPPPFNAYICRILKNDICTYYF